MDRNGDSILTHYKITVFLVALVGFSACAANLVRPETSQPESEIVELKWLSLESDRVTALTSRPSACITSSLDRVAEEKLRLGELIFNSPALLGGQAEKKGLSCGSCHRNGRGNPNFQFEAISGPPGTADVTSGLFSKVRADNTFNPVPIPDLARSEGRQKVNRADDPALTKFVREQIVDEFSGDDPPPEILAALLVYLKSIDDRTAECADTAQTVSWQSDWNAAKRAVFEAARATSDQSRAFYTRTARLSLRNIHDRFAAPEHVLIRSDLINLSRALSRDPVWPESAAILRSELESQADTSLYRAEPLAKWLGTPP